MNLMCLGWISSVDWVYDCARHCRCKKALPFESWVKECDYKIRTVWGMWHRWPPVTSSTRTAT